MEVEITYEKEDWLRFQGFLEKEIPKSITMPWPAFFKNILLWTVIGFVAMFMFQYIGEFHWPTAGCVAVFFVILFLLFIRYLNRIKKGFAPSASGLFVGTHRFTITESGIESEGAGYNGSHSWSVVEKIVRENSLIMLFTDTANAFIFPEEKLKDPDMFFKYAMECNKAN